MGHGERGAAMSEGVLLAALGRCVGQANLLVAPDDVEPYIQDWRGAFRGAALAVACPGTTDEVELVVRACREAGSPVVPQGGNTGMCGGAIPDASGRAVVVAMRRMHRVLDVDAVNDAMTVEAGCVLHHVQEAASAADRYFPLSLAAEGSCQIGGNLATNAGGINVLRYGNARDLVLGLEVVLPDATVWNGLRALRKDNRGYDMKQIFVGAEGTLGIITRAVLKLFPKPASRVSAWLALADPAAAVAVLERLRARCADELVAYELIGRACVDLVLAHVPSARDPFRQQHAWYVLLDFAGAVSEHALREKLETLLAEEADRGDLADAVIAQSLAQREDLWRLRESIPEATRATGPALRSDIAVAVSDIPEFVARATAAVHATMPGVRVVCFGHVGDGNLHFNVLPPALSGARADWAKPLYPMLYDVVDALRGSFSAEHGVGQAKRGELRRYKSEAEIAMMQTLKQAFDPMNLMNPGKIL
jgi:FAD/FMN-containing dehydrogenase